MMNTTTGFDGLKLAIEKAGFDGQFSAIPREQLEPVMHRLSLSSELLDWYQNSAPMNLYIPWHGDDLLLYNPLELITYQEGYRWEVGQSEIHPSWNINWVVVGDVSGDPIIAHIDQIKTPISMAIHGIGKWEPRIITLSLATFLDALSAWVQIAGKYRGRVSGEDGTLLLTVVDELKAALSVLLTQEQVDNFLSFIV